MAPDEEAPPEAHGVQALGEVEVRPRLLDPGPHVGGPGLDLPQDGPGLGEPGLLLELVHVRQPVGPDRQVGSLPDRHFPLAQSGGAGQTEQEHRSDDQGCRRRVPPQPAEGTLQSTDRSGRNRLVPKEPI